MYPSDKLPVALLFGGAGAEHEISCRSAAYVGGVFERSGVPTLYVGIDRRGAPRLCDGAEIGEDRPPVFPVRLGEESGFFRGGEILPVGSAFPILHGDRGEDGEIQGALKAAGIPFVGCGVFAGAVAADKCAAKRLA